MCVLPKYEIIKQNILKEIDEGKFKPGSKIYSEGDLKKIYQVSNTTVVKALNDLVAEGYLIRRQGEGTFVRKNMLHRKVSFSERLTKKFNPQKKSERVETSIQICEDKRVLSQFEGKGPLYEIVQRAMIDDALWKIQKRFVQTTLLSEEAVRHITDGGSVSKELGIENNLVNMPMSMTIEFKTVDIPETNELQTNSVVIVKKTIFNNTTKEVIEYSESFIHPDFYEVNLIAE